MGSASLIEATWPQETADASTAVIYLETGREAVSCSRRDFMERTELYAKALLDLGIRPGELVLLAHDDTMALVHCFWGLLRIGAIPSIYTLPNERLFPEIYMANVAELVRSVDARALLTLDELAATFGDKMTCPVIGFGRLRERLPAEGSAFSLPAHAARSEDIAYVQTSSGTTGSQRCVPTTHGMLRAQLDSFARRMELNDRDVIVNWMPLYHDGGLILGAILPFYRRIPVVLIPPLDWVRHPAILFRAIHEHGGTICNMPNFAFNHCARRIRERDVEGISLRNVRAFVNGSERVYATSFERFLTRFAPLGVAADRFGVAYGLAENTLMVAHTPLGRPLVFDAVDRETLEVGQAAVPVDPQSPEAVVNVSCGPPLDGVEVRILDDENRDLPSRRVGQVAIRSDSLFAGYYRRPELTAEIFRDGWFLTGDMGYMADGELYIVGRLKDLIINGGKNIYPADLEEIVTAVPGVRPGRTAVFGVPDETEGTELIAVVAEVDTDDAEKKTEVERLIRRDIMREIGVTVSFVDVVHERWIIKTSSGKTARTANRRKWLEARKGRSGPAGGA